MSGTWEQVAASSGAHYRTYREDVAQFVQSISVDTVIFSHFIAINAVIGAATDDDRVVIGQLDNCSVSVFDTSDKGLSLVEMGGEADTLIR
jgi:broad specificity phosphatase PhoE